MRSEVLSATIEAPTRDIQEIVQGLQAALSLYWRDCCAPFANLLTSFSKTHVSTTEDNDSYDHSTPP